MPSVCSQIWSLPGLAGARGQDRVQHLARLDGLFLADSGVKHGDEVPQLRRAEPGIHGRAEMEAQLRAKARHGGQGRDGRQFPALMVQIVAGKNVREQMLLEKGVNGGRVKS